VTTETNATNGDRFKFAGMQYDAVIGQYYDHARWYASVTGRFMGQDPMRFGAGDANLFRYVGNGATGATDPTGEFWWIIPAIGIAVAVSGCGQTTSPPPMPPLPGPIPPPISPGVAPTAMQILHSGPVTQALPTMWKNANINRSGYVHE
jgi:RHS repeat-associated protein